MFEAVNWNELFSKVIMAVVTLAIPMVLKPVLSWLNAKAKSAWHEYEYRKPQVAKYLEEFAKVAVMAAEQTGLNDEINDKKTYAVEVVDRLLAKNGFEVDVFLIEAAIEKSVLEVFHPEKIVNEAIRTPERW